jgi:hypothetical protein
VTSPCRHDGFHDIRTVYDRIRGVLLFWWFCEDCGKRLGVAERTEYRPVFERHTGA